LIFLPEISSLEKLVFREIESLQLIMGCEENGPNVEDLALVKLHLVLLDQSVVRDVLCEVGQNVVVSKQGLTWTC
jgi:hypothetical protein